MSTGDEGDDAERPDGRSVRSRLPEHDRRRLRSSHLTAAGGLVLGAVGAVAVGALGASGRAGIAVVLAVGAAGCVLAALVTVVLAMVDEFRRAPVSRRRAVVALGYFLAGALLLVMSTGAAGA